MKISKLFPGIILPFLMFAFFGVDCPDEEADEKICKETRDSIVRMYRLNQNSYKTIEIKTPNARAECSAFFLVEFGWEDITKFQSDISISPIDDGLANLKLTLGEKSYSNTYIVQSIIKEGNKLNPDNVRGYVWSIELPVEAPSSSGDTQFYIKIEQDIVDTEYNFWINIAIEYSYV